MSEPRPRRRDAVEHRARIVAAARLVLAEDPGAPLEAIAERAGLSRRTVYGHIDSREALVAEVVAAGAVEIALAVEAAVSAARERSARATAPEVAHAVAPAHSVDPAHTVARIGGALWTQIDSVRAVASIALAGPLRPAVAAALAPVRARLAAAIADGVAAGRFRPDLEPVLLAGLVERAAIAVLDEAVVRDLPAETAHRLVMTNGLAAAGLAWSDADAAATRVLAEARAAA